MEGQNDTATTESPIAVTVVNEAGTPAKVKRKRKRRPWRALLGAVAFGQFLSLLITATGVASSHLAIQGVHAPTTLSLCNYVLLALVYGTLLLYRRRNLEVQWYFYVMLSIVDVEANYLVVKAYQYTTITSVMLLDRGSLFFVLALTWIILKTKYNLRQLSGVAICMGGVLVLFLSNAQPSKDYDKKEMLKGDLLVLSASMLYAISNVIEVPLVFMISIDDRDEISTFASSLLMFKKFYVKELLAKRNDFVELMALLGCFGSIISAFQIYLLEIPELKSIKCNIYIIMPILGFAICLFTFYTLVPFFLKEHGSTMLNLSLITSDMWAILVQNFVYHQKVGRLYFMALAMIILGLIIYSFFSKSSIPQSTIADKLPSTQDNESIEANSLRLEFTQEKEAL